MSRASVTLLWAALAAISLLGSARMHGPLAKLREKDGLTPAADPMENAPPLVSFTTVALGGFRGVAADVLWLRAMELQERGQYIELVTLADWITKLQPRSPAIWSFQAWNLAFNVSVMFHSPEDRWRWVQHGIRLLRDEGLLYCPGQPKLYEDLSWFFNFKMGEDLDDAHHHYKMEWAKEMQRVMGGARPDFAALVAAPKTLELLQRDPAVRAWIESLRAEGLNPEDPRGLDTGFGSEALRARGTRDPGAAAWRAFLRARLLRDTYHMSPEDLQRVDAQCGPLDWRLPDAHAVFWAEMGLPFARTDFQRVSLQRRGFQAMAASFVRGRLVTSPEDPAFTLSPNLDLLPHVRAAYEKAIADNPSNDALTTAYQNFISDAIMISFSYNRMALTQELYAVYRKKFPAPGLPADAETFVAVNYAKFVEGLTPGQAFAAVESACYQSAFWRALGDADQAAGYERLAGVIWQFWMGERTDPLLKARVGLPPLSVLRDEAIRRVQSDLAKQRARVSPDRS